MAWVTLKDGRRVDTDWFDKDKQIADNKKEADKLNAKNAKIDDKVASKFSKKVQSKITFAEKDRGGKYHIVVNDETYGEASFHETNFGDLKWYINAFLKDGSKF